MLPAIFRGPKDEVKLPEIEKPAAPPAEEEKDGEAEAEEEEELSEAQMFSRDHTVPVSTNNM